MSGAPLFPELSPEQLGALDQWLDVALDLDDAGRAALVARLRQEHPELAGPLARLMHTAAPGFLPLPDERPGGNTNDTGLVPEGTLLGPWRIVAYAASGGSADVYRGIRADGTFERQVAIKILRADTARLVEHFAREQRLLARLEHPQIASILDAGRTPGVGAWFVMPWVEGRDLAAWIATGPGWRERVQVFRAIADAVQFAHQRLVVHRDLKPSNVRVAADGTVVLLDFGIAMLLDSPESSLQPSRTQMAFTPAYASPEQLRGEPLGVQTDVFALGVLLFELLAGKPAYPEARQSLADAVRVICQGPVPAMTLDPRLPRPMRLRLRDLDAVLARAMARDPAARYASVAALAADVRAFAEGRAVSARARGVFGHLLAAAVRHPLVAGLVVALGVGATVGATFYVQQNRRIAEERAEALAEVARLESLREHFSLVLREGVAEQGMGARAALDESVARLDQSFAGQPAVQARLLLSLAEIYLAAGDNAACLSTVARLADTPALMAGLTTRQQGETWLTRVTAQLRLGQVDDATASLDAWRTTIPGFGGEALAAEHAIAAATLRRLKGEPLPALEDQNRAVASLDAAPDATVMARGIAHANLGTALLQAGKFAPAREQFERAIALWNSGGLSLNWNVLTTRTNLAHLALLQGDERVALAEYGDIERSLRARGDRSASFAALINGKARALLAIGDGRTAAQLADEALAILDARSGGQGLDRIGVLLSRIDIGLANGEPVTAWIEDATARLASLPSAHPFHARLALARAVLLQSEGRHADAVVAFDQVFPKLLAAPATMRPAAARAAIQWLQSAQVMGEPGAVRQALADADGVLAAFQPETGFDRLELAAWRACAEATPGGKAISAFRARASDDNPRWRALARACGSFVRD